MNDFLHPKNDTTPPKPDGADRHASVPKPLQEAADVLSSVGNEPSETMAPGVKARQRAALLAHAEQLKPSVSMPSSEPAKKPKQAPVAAHPWRGFALGFAGVLAAVALVLVFVSPSGLSPLPGSRQLATALAIPAAHAGDAFLLVADSSDAAGVASNSTLTITSKVDVAPEVLKQSLKIEPPLDVDVTKEGEGTYKVTPKQDLEPGETYRVSIATLVEKDDGTRLSREFSWALQAKNDMRVLSTIPRDGSGFVPVTTGIEFKLSRDGWSDATSSFSIVPNVPGRFEARGRYLTFIPTLPFEAGRRYEVTLKKGFGAGEGDAGLAKDEVIRFETAAPSPSGPNANQPTSFSISEFQEKAPNATWLLDLGYTDSRNAGTPIKAEIIGYRLDANEARRVLDGRLQIPGWAPAEAGRYEAYENANKSEAFRAEVDTVVTDYERKVNMPAAPAGFYAVRVTPKTPNAKPSWMFLQLTDVASYLIADKDRLYVWAINPSTNRPLSNLRVRMPDQDKRTNESGLVELKSPALLSATEVEPGDVFPYQLVQYGDEGQSNAAFGIVRKTYNEYWFDFGNRDSGVSKTWGYLYLDRPLYRTQDELKLFGLAQDRDTRQSAGEVEVRLRKSSYWIDWGTGREKVYQSKKVQPDAAGRFEASFNWNELAQGYYTMEIRRGTETVSSRSFEIREFAKPAYSLSIVMDKEEVFDGDQISGTLKASFFEGTPMPKLRAKLTWNDGGERIVETDDAGMVRFTIPYRMNTCVSPREDRDAYCPGTVWLNVNAVPEQGEEGQVMGTASVVIQRGEAGLTLDGRADRVTANVTGNVWRRILGNMNTDRSQAWANRQVTLTIFGMRWEQIPNGFRYDAIEKKQVQIYRYEQRFDAPVVTNVTSDARGNFTHSFQVDDTRDYYVIAEARDDKNRVTQTRNWIYPGSYGGGVPRQMPNDLGMVDPYPRLEITPKPPEGGPYGFAINDEVTATYLMGSNPVDVSKTPGILYLTASRGIRSATVTNNAEYKFRFDQAFVPNAEVRAITWVNGRFQPTQATVEYRREEKGLTIEAAPRKTAYAPGENVEVDVTVRVKATGAPARDAVIAFGAVDKALLAASYDEKASPLESIYGYVADGILFTSRLHDEEFDGFAGAEMGGGGMDAAKLQSQVRRNFKDTAAFGTVTTDGNGKATVRFTAPDNVTGWRFELIGVTAALEAGAGRADVNVTKPIFVDVVAPPRLLTTDKPYLKLRAYGAGVETGEAVTFSVKAPTLGIDQQVPGRAGESLAVGISQLVDGQHPVTISITSAKGTDAIERMVTVVPSRFLRDAFVRVDAAPGSGLPDTGRPEATIQFVPQNRASLQPLAFSLVNTWSSRADALLSTRLASQILRDEFKAGEDRWWGSWLPNDQDLSTRLADYQDEAGGIRLLSYGSSDLELSAEVAATVPEYIDRDSLAGYFWQALDSKESSREVQIQALSGLAALGEPVLTSLQAAANTPDLSWREKLAIARGLEAAGDRERARGILDSLLQNVERRDEVTRLALSENMADVYEATADAAALAARLAHPEADNLMRFIETNWSDEAFPVLSKARYLKAVLPTRANRDIVLAYTLGEGESVLTFKEGAVQSLDLTRQEAANFRVTRVDGPVAMTFVRREAGRPASKPEVAIARRYEANKPLADLKEGDAVRIVLTPEFRASAQDGCYAVRDHLPGGFQAVTGWGAAEAYGMNDKRGWYPSLVENGEVTFTACKFDSWRSDPIVYTARVVTRGSYTAEAPVIQHEQFPSVAAVGQDQTIEIK